MKTRKVGVVGLGHVGAHVAYALAVQGIADELVLVDMDAKKVASECQDLRDAAAYLPHRVHVAVGDFADLGDCDVIVNSTGKIDILRANHNRVDEMDFTIRAVRDILRAKEDFLPSAETIIQEVARFYELDSDVLRGQSQNKEIATARNVAMYIIREMTQLSLAEIGQQFGGRHHSTVLNSINRVEKMMKDQPELTEIIRDITNAVNSAW